MNFLTEDENLVKKDDDHRPHGHMHSSPWPRAPAQPLRRRRIIYILCGALFIYLFIKNIPTDVGPHPRWADTRVYQGSRTPGAKSTATTGAASQSAPTKKPPRPASPVESEQHYHDGPIKFYRLAVSLHAVAKLGGQKDLNKNVLFAASSLKSVSELLPIACEMARWDRNDVHLAIMGRDSMAISEIQEVNGIKQEDCNIYWHDARPDFSEWSTDYRMESSVAASLEHIQTFIHPQVILIDDAKREERFFVTAIREKAQELFKPLIELPSSAMDNLMWITRLDSVSLAAWSRVYIDIIIQAPSGSSGSIVRLLKSLEGADYFGIRRPHLTIELPATIDEPTAKFLDFFTWPPVDWSGAPHASQVTLRHRIQRKTTTPEEASARLVEAFWPKRTLDSHVLLLSPQVELSPLYFHYLFYTILEYRYSQLARQSDKYQNMMGISLDLPKFHLDDKTPFFPPKIQETGKKASAFPAAQAPFLWQSPNDNAALYFGDKWIEFHSFLSLRLTKPRSIVEKLVSKRHPAWMEYLFDLIRLRGYSLLYPGAFFDDFNLVTTHNELYQVPEEFPQALKLPNLPIPDPTEVLGANVSHSRHQPLANEKPLLESSLVDVLPNKADLVEVERMPLLSSIGVSQSFKEVADTAQTFSHEFRVSLGGCVSGLQPPPSAFRSAADLFCGSDEPFDFQDPAEATRGVKVVENTRKPAEDPVNDPDQITDLEAKIAKKESTSHFDRQAGEDKAAAAKLDDIENVKSKISKDGSQTKAQKVAAASAMPETASDIAKLNKGKTESDDTKQSADEKIIKASKDKAPGPAPTPGATTSETAKQSPQPGKDGVSENKGAGW